MESHEPDLRAEVHDEAKVFQLQEDYRRAGLDLPTAGLLDFAVKLTLSPREMSRQDVDKLRSLGFADEDILDAVQMIGYFNYINRVLDGLGAQPEPNMRYGQRRS
ncbi:MAG: peroxidase [Planctomycetes bacterium]|nr:peroxidase [Planctomycetota bacterium]